MKKNTIPSFIQKTWEILQDRNCDEALAWTNSGCSFSIKDKDKLCSEILPKYFKHSNFSSFVRQLNMYNFHKIRNCQDDLEFFHKLFRKDRRQLLIGIKRKPSQAQIQQGQLLIARLMDSHYQNLVEPSRISELNASQELTIKNQLSSNNQQNELDISLSNSYYNNLENKKILFQAQDNAKNLPENPLSSLSENIMFKDTGPKLIENIILQWPKKMTNININ